VYSFAIIYYLNKLDASLGNGHSDLSGFGIDSVLDEFFDDWVVNYLPLYGR
jgi:hypothetical protein